MLIRLPISLAQLKAGNYSEKLENKISIVFFAQIKKAYETTIKVLLTLFKHGNNFYKQLKQ